MSKSVLRVLCGLIVVPVLLLFAMQLYLSPILSAVAMDSASTSVVATGKQVYVFSSGNSTTDQALLNIISSGGYSPTLGVQPATWTGAQANLSQFSAVVLQDNHTWWSGANMSIAGQNSLVDYVQGGGGLITAEWVIYFFPNESGSYPISAILPTTMGACCGVASTTYSVSTPDAVINAGLPSSFTFSMISIGGYETGLQPKLGATSFYSSSSMGYSGLVGWQTGAGRVASFSNLMTSYELANNNLATLLINTLNWVEGQSAAPNRIFLSKKVGLNGACNNYHLNVEVGTEVTYCYQVTNQSAFTLTQHTLVDDKLGMLMNNVPYTIEVGGSYSITTTAIITENMLNVATWSATDTENNVISDTAEAYVSIAETDLQVQKWVYAPTVVAGDKLTYYIYYQNWTNVSAQNVRITDTLPISLSYDSSGVSWAVGTQTITLQSTGSGVSWYIPELPPYSYGVVTVSVQLTDTAAVNDLIQNQVTISSSTADSNLTNNTYQNAVQVATSSKDLYVEKWVYGSPQPGSTLFYYIYYRNIGNQTINSVLITDTLPNNVTYVSQYDYYNPSAMERVGNDLVWSINSLSPYQTGYIYLTVVVSDNVAGGTVLTNVVSISGAGTDVDLSNNIDVVTSTVFTPGHITGTVTLVDDTPVQAAMVYAYQATAPYGSGWAWTDADGNYKIEGLPTGNYYVYFYSQSGNRIYDQVTTAISATLVSVLSGQTTPNINAQYNLPVPPLATVNAGNNYVYTDPSTGESSIWINRANPSDLTISMEITCTGSVTPENVLLVFETTSTGTFEYAMTKGSGDTYSVTVPAGDLTSGTFSYKCDCGNQTIEKVIGHGLIDPSGYITDAKTGAPIVGATVQLFKIVGWVPKDGPADTRPNTCHTIDSRPSPYWNDLPPAPQIGVLGDPLGDPQEIDPKQNPLLTDETGYYAWDVAPGCWYIVITAKGYETRVSPAVGVPPEVTDLHLTMNKLNTIYLPIVTR